jgi:hypothetical protein
VSADDRNGERRYERWQAPNARSHALRRNQEEVLALMVVGMDARAVV